MKRTHKVARKSKETEITALLGVDGTGKFDSNLTDEMLRHMLDTLVRYASWDMELSASGDMLHHLSEDIAITLGKALERCAADQPIERFGFSIVPMDDALVEVAVDLSGRAYYKSDPLMEPFGHFLRSLATNAAMNLHVVLVRGEDGHHVVEAVFKGLGMALRSALAVREALASTKGNVKLEVD